MASIEETFNQALGEVLRQINPKFHRIHVEEIRHLPGSKRPDILISDATIPPVAIECSYENRDADNDARSRLGLRLKTTNHPIESSIAISIPARFRDFNIEQSRNELLEGEFICYSLHQRLKEKKGEGYKYRRWVEDGFIKGTAYDVAQLVVAASVPKESVMKIADQISSHLEKAASILEEFLSSEEQQTVASTVHQVTSLKGLRTTSVLWLNAFIVQQRLANLGTPESQHLSFSKEIPIPSEVLTAWKKILESNWNSIFKPAVDSLEVVMNLNPEAASKAIRHVLDGVEQIFSHGYEVLFNVGAELFPRLSDDRKQAAAFYTQPSTAELLSSLTIRKSDFSDEIWANADFPTFYKIGDLACGTGTLLRAGYERFQRFHEENSNSIESLRHLHKNANEHGLIGIDVSPIAAHLASSTLAIQGYGDPYSRTKIGWCEVGGERHATGSMELFEESDIKDLFGSIGHSVHGKGVLNPSIGDVSVSDSELQYILMNPPYSRTRGGQSAFDIAGLSEEERKNCQKRWGRLIRNEPANKTAGMAATFLALAKRKLKPGGRMGFVLPLTAAFAPTWKETRAMIETEFEEVIAIAVSGGKALGYQALSADTGMEEMLLICQRRRHSPVSRRGKLSSRNANSQANLLFCVTLYQPPLRLGEAGEIGKAILHHLNLLKASSQAYKQPIRLGNSELGQIFKFQIREGGEPWSALGLMSIDLTIAATSLQDGKLVFGNDQYEFDIPMCTVSDLFEVGPTHNLIGSIPNSTAPSGVFEIYPVRSETDAIGADRCMWHADSENKRSLLTNPTHKGIPKEKASENDLKRIRQTASSLFYAKNLRWTSQCLLSVITKDTNIGGRSWLSIRHKDIRVQHAFCLWSNSILGMLLHWNVGQRTQSGRSTTQVKAIKGITCPDFRSLTSEKLDYASKIIKLLQTQTLMPACQAHADEVRKKIDNEIVNIMDLPEEANAMIEQLRYLWCREPSVHGNDKEALRMLQ